MAEDTFIWTVGGYLGDPGPYWGCRFTNADDCNSLAGWSVSGGGYGMALGNNLQCSFGGGFNGRWWDPTLQFGYGIELW